MHAGQSPRIGGFSKASSRVQQSLARVAIPVFPGSSSSQVEEDQGKACTKYLRANRKRKEGVVECTVQYCIVELQSHEEY